MPYLIFGKFSEGNDKLFKDEEYTKACDTYLECLMALDFGNTPEQKAEVETRSQIPALCNMAACLIAEGDWGKVDALCTEVLMGDGVVCC